MVLYCSSERGQITSQVQPMGMPKGHNYDVGVDNPFVRELRKWAK